MDDATRGFVESMIDRAMMADILPDVEWIGQQIPISSLRDLALGYFAGLSDAYSHAISTLDRNGIIPSEEDKQTIRGMIRRRLPEIVEKIERELNR